jgi:hypothetical protein
MSIPPLMQQVLIAFPGVLHQRIHQIQAYSHNLQGIIRRPPHLSVLEIVQAPPRSGPLAGSTISKTIGFSIIDKGFCGWVDGQIALEYPSQSGSVTSDM